MKWNVCCVDPARACGWVETRCPPRLTSGGLQVTCRVLLMNSDRHGGCCPALCIRLLCGGPRRVLVGAAAAYQCCVCQHVAVLWITMRAALLTALLKIFKNCWSRFVLPVWLQREIVWRVFCAQSPWSLSRCMWSIKSAHILFFVSKLRSKGSLRQSYLSTDYEALEWTIDCSCWMILGKLRWGLQGSEGKIKWIFMPQDSLDLPSRSQQESHNAKTCLR